MKEKTTEVKDFNEEEFEEEIVEDVKPEKFSRTKAFLAKHKKTIKKIGLAAVGAAVAAGAGAMAIKNKMSEQYNAGYEDGLDQLWENATTDSEIEALEALEDEANGQSTDIETEEN